MIGKCEPTLIKRSGKANADKFVGHSIIMMYIMMIWLSSPAS